EGTPLAPLTTLSPAAARALARQLPGRVGPDLYGLRSGLASADVTAGNDDWRGSRRPEAASGRSDGACALRRQSAWRPRAGEAASEITVSPCAPPAGWAEPVAANA